MKDVTKVNHPDPVVLSTDNQPLVPPLHRSVKYTFPTLEETERAFRSEREGFFYTRYGNPTTRQLETLLAELQDREVALVTNSGMSAISTCLFSLLRQGDHVIMFIESYRPSRYIVRNMLGRYGVTHSLLSVDDHNAIEQAAKREATRVIFFESPTNPITRIADIEFITRTARENGLVTILDNTFAGFHNHGQYPIDIYLHSLTKFASGHGDAMGGAIITSNEIIQRMRSDFGNLGSAIGPSSAWLILRGMKTYPLRYRIHCANASAIAQFLEGHERVRRVYYPGLPSHPDCKLAQSTLKDYGAILSFELEGSEAGSRAVIDRLRLFQLAASLGSTESLVTPALSFYGLDLTEEERHVAKLTPTTIRLAVGIEDPDDLMEDLSQALDG